MGLQARLMSQALRKLTAIVSRSKSCLIFINQLREKIGMFVGNPETTTGGRALKFYASVRIDVKKILSIKQGEEITLTEDGLHIELLDLQHPLQVGRTFALRLIFESAGAVETALNVDYAGPR